jgi:hypothetical protein
MSIYYCQRIASVNPGEALRWFCSRGIITVLRVNILNSLDEQMLAVVHIETLPRTLYLIGEKSAWILSADFALG